MNKQKILLLIPLFIITGFLIYTWFDILFTDDIALWKHYVGLLLFIPVLILFFKNFKWSVLLTGIYLVAGMFYLFTITPWVTTFNFLKIGRVTIPLFNPPLFIIFLSYFILNFNTLIDMKLDYEEARKSRRQKEL